MGDSWEQRCNIYQETKKRLETMLKRGKEIKLDVVKNILILIKNDSNSLDVKIKTTACDILIFLLNADFADPDVKWHLYQMFADPKISKDFKNLIKDKFTIFFKESIGSITLDLTSVFLTFEKEHATYVIDLLKETTIINDKEHIKNILLLNMIPVTFKKDLPNEIRNELLPLTTELIEKCPISTLTEEELNLFLQHVQTDYIQVINNLRDEKYTNWYKLWILLIKFCSNNIFNSMELTNKILRVVEFAFRNPNYQQRLIGYDCWKEFINVSSLDKKIMCNPKQIKLLLTPLNAKFAKKAVVIVKRFDTFIYLIEKLQENTVLVLNEFLEFCFGPLGKDEKPANAKSIKELWMKSISVLLAFLGHPEKCTCCSCSDFLKFERPIIDKSNIKHHLFTIIFSIYESCMLLDQIEIDQKVKMQIIGCLWSSFLNIMETQDKAVKEISCGHLFVVFGNIAKNYTSSHCEQLLKFLLTAGLRCISKFVEFTQELIKIVMNLLFFHDLPKNLTISLHQFIESCMNEHRCVTSVVKYFIEQKPAKFNLDELFEIWSAIILKYDNAKLDLTNFSQFPILYAHLLRNEKILKNVKLQWMLWYKRNALTKIVKLLVLGQLEKAFHKDASVCSTVTSFIAALVQFEENLWHNEDIRDKFLTLLTVVLGYPNLSPNEVTIWESALSKLCQCITNETGKLQLKDENVTSISLCYLNLLKHYKRNSVLEQLHSFLSYVFTEGKINIPKEYLQEELGKINNLDKLQNQQLSEIWNLFKIQPLDAPPPTESSTPTRSVKILKNVRSGSTPSKASSNLRLFGKDVETMSPLKVRGSQMKNSPSLRSQKIMKGASKSPKSFSVMDENASDFVAIDTEVKFQPEKLNDHQKEVMRRRREDIPALYTDLSQSQSQDLFAKDESSNSQSSSGTLTPVIPNIRENITKASVQEKPEELWKMPVTPKRVEQKAKTPLAVKVPSSVNIHSILTGINHNNQTFILLNTADIKLKPINTNINQLQLANVDANNSIIPSKSNDLGLHKMIASKPGENQIDVIDLVDETEEKIGSEVIVIDNDNGAALKAEETIMQTENDQTNNEAKSECETPADKPSKVPHPTEDNRKDEVQIDKLQSEKTTAETEKLGKSTPYKCNREATNKLENIKLHNQNHDGQKKNENCNGESCQNKDELKTSDNVKREVSKNDKMVSEVPNDEKSEANKVKEISICNDVTSKESKQPTSDSEASKSTENEIEYSDTDSNNSITKNIPSDHTYNKNNTRNRKQPSTQINRISYRLSAKELKNIEMDIVGGNKFVGTLPRLRRKDSAVRLSKTPIKRKSTSIDQKTPLSAKFPIQNVEKVQDFEQGLSNSDEFLAIKGGKLASAVETEEDGNSATPKKKRRRRSKNAASPNSDKEKPNEVQEKQSTTPKNKKIKSTPSSPEKSTPSSSEKSTSSSSENSTDILKLMLLAPLTLQETKSSEKSLKESVIIVNQEHFNEVEKQPLSTSTSEEAITEKAVKRRRKKRVCFGLPKRPSKKPKNDTISPSSNNSRGRPRKNRGKVEVKGPSDEKTSTETSSIDKSESTSVAKKFVTDTEKSNISGNSTDESTSSKRKERKRNSEIKPSVYDLLNIASVKKTEKLLDSPSQKTESQDIIESSQNDSVSSPRLTKKTRTSDAKPKIEEDTLSQADTETCESKVQSLTPDVHMQLPLKPELTESEKVMSRMETASILSENSQSDKSIDQTIKPAADTSNSLKIESAKCDSVPVPVNDAEKIETTTNLLSSPKVQEDNLPTSPVLGDTPVRNQELLNNTLDISPINSQEVPTGEIINQVPDKDTKSDSSEDEVANKILEKCNMMPVSFGSNIRSSKLLNLINVDSPISSRSAHSKCTATKLTMSPATERIKKLMSRFHDLKDNCDVERNKEEVEDFLTFRKEVPSPLATPGGSIMKKRKAPDTADEGITPNAKRKRVNFSDPCTTSKKVYIPHKEELSCYRPVIPQSLFDYYDEEEYFANDEKIDEEEEEKQEDMVDMPILERQDSAPPDTEESMEVANALLLCKNKPICPELINCGDNISSILREVSSPMFSKLLQRKLEDKNINTVGDLARLNEVEISRLPFKKPALSCVLKALNNYQKVILIKEEEVDTELFESIRDKIKALVEFSDLLKKHQNMKASMKSVGKELRNNFTKEHITCDMQRVVLFIKDAFEINFIELLSKEDLLENFNTFMNLAVSDKSLSPYIEAEINQYVDKKPLVTLLKNRPIEQISTALQECVKINGFNKEKLLKACFIPFIKSPRDLNFYFSSLTVVELHDIFVQRIQGSELRVFMEQIIDSYGNYTIAECVNKEDVLKICNEKDLTTALAQKCSTAKALQTVRNIIVAHSENRNDLLVDVFKLVTELLPFQTLINLHVDLIKSFPSKLNEQ